MLTTERIIGTIGFMGGIMSLPTPFTWAWGKMLLFSQEALCQPGEHINPDYARMSLHDSARNELASRMMGDWLLILDTDTEFEADFAARLVATMYRYDLDVVTGIYSFKTPPYSPVLYMWNPETDQHMPIGDWDRSSDIFPVNCAGGGCLLIRKRVFDRIRDELHEQPFARMTTRGEDMSFFRRIRALGIKAYCAWKVEMVHLDYQRIRTSNFYDAEQVSQGLQFEAVSKRLVPATAGTT